MKGFLETVLDEANKINKKMEFLKQVRKEIELSRRVVDALKKQDYKAYGLLEYEYRDLRHKNENAERMNFDF